MLIFAVAAVLVVFAFAAEGSSQRKSRQGDHRTSILMVNVADHLALLISVKQLIQRAAILGALIESSEAQRLAGDKVDLNTYFQAINSQRRILSTLGLKRRSRDITPTLSDDLIERSSTLTEDPADVEIEEVPP